MMFDRSQLTLFGWYGMVVEGWYWLWFRRRGFVLQVLVKGTVSSEPCRRNRVVGTVSSNSRTKRSNYAVDM